ncbi:MAG: sigma-70 family RNA polymerase sigma factor [Phycisphaeraceae bacterium]|nr:sigma-70 family RNA polymerase sigma factor [Phycisphaeraceae bacterium]
MAQDDGNSLTKLSDEALVEAYRAGRAEAFTVLVERYRRELFHFLVRFVANRAAAEDVFQESFLQVHNAIATFDTSRRFKPWLFTISANKARDWLRRNRTTQHSHSAPLPGSSSGNDGDGQTAFIDLMPAPETEPSGQVESEEQRQQVRKVVDSLPDHLREVLVLAYFQRLAYKEISEIIQIPLGTVKSRLHAAVATFAQMWKDRTGDDPEA